MRFDLRHTSIASCLVLLLFAFPAMAHSPSGHHEGMAVAHDENAMKAQHERMGNFRAAMVALGEAVIHGNKTGAGEQANRLTDALRDHEKDVPHKNVSRTKEFQAYYGELQKRTATLAGAAKTGNLRKTSLAYGRVLEVCASCHAKFRD